MAKGPVKFQEYESESTEEEDEGSEEGASEKDEGSEEGASENDEGSEEGASSDSDSGHHQNPIARKSSPLRTASIGKSQFQAASRIQEEMKEQSESQTGTDSATGSESDSEEPAPNASGPVDGWKTSNSGGGKPTPKASVPDTVTSFRVSGVKQPAEEKGIEAKDLKKSNKKPKSSVLDAVTPVKASGVKRHAEEKDTEAKDGKKSKKKPPEHELETSATKRSNDDSKKQLFQRLWSEDDEIVILKGMIDYAERKKSDPVTDLSAFHNFIRNNLHVDVTRSQLQDKIRRLKKKYENNKGKEKEGKDRIFSKPHEQKAYELSKQIWGCENGKGCSPRVNGSTVRRCQRANTIDNGEFEDATIARIINGGLDRVGSLSAMKSNDMRMDERVYRIGTELFEGKDGVEGASEWRMLAVQEIEIHLKMLEVKRAQVKLVLDALTSSNE